MTTEDNLRQALNGNDFEWSKIPFYRFLEKDKNSLSFKNLDKREWCWTSLN